MTRQRITFAVAACCLVAACPIVASAATVFFDDFSDGQPAVGWVSNGQLTFENDSMRIQGIGGIWSDVNQLDLHDTSMRTRVRLLEGGTISIAVREPFDNTDQNYNGYLSRTLNEAGISAVNAGMVEWLRTVPLELDITNNDVMMQLDVIGNVISFWAWLPNEAMPITPLISTTDDRIARGDIFVWVGSEDVFDESVGPADAEFRFVHVADTHIPETLLGDVNLDGDVNGLDVDPFVDVLLSGPCQAEADMNADLVVNGLDVDPFVAAVVGGAQSIPEPSTLLLCLLAPGVVGGWRKQRG